jgi:hypothetical protein
MILVTNHYHSNIIILVRLYINIVHICEKTDGYYKLQYLKYVLNIFEVCTIELVTKFSFIFIINKNTKINSFFS